MKVADYIRDKLRAFGASEALLFDMSVSSSISGDEELTSENIESVCVAMIPILEELILAPRQKSVSESGFSMSWDFDNLGRYYLWLCRKYGRTPAEELSDALGLSRIKDLTDRW